MDYITDWETSMQELQKLRNPYRKASGIRSGPSRLFDVVRQLLEERIGPRQDVFACVSQLWEELLPETLRQHCRLDGISGGCLKVLVDSPCYMHELRFLSESLLDELNRSCPKARITRIKTALG